MVWQYTIIQYKSVQIVTSEIFRYCSAGLSTVLQVPELLLYSLHVDDVCHLQSLHIFTQSIHLSNINTFTSLSAADEL